MSSLRAIVVGVCLAVAAIAPASAATFNITFFDFGGTSVGTGTFTAEDVNFAPVTAFSATVLGTTYSSLNASLGLVVSRDFPNAGDRSINGFAFKPGETRGANNTGVVQMVTSGVPSNIPGQLQTLSSVWFFSACSSSICGGGGETSGNFTVTPTVVPLPASLPLLLAGLGGLALVAKRKARRAKV